MSVPIMPVSAYMRIRLPGPTLGRPILASISLRPSSCRNTPGIILQVRAAQEFHSSRPGQCSAGKESAARPLLTVNIRTPLQVRRQSTTPPGDEQTEKGLPQRQSRQQQTKPANVAFFPLVLRIIRGSLRSLVMPFRRGNLRNLYRTNPEELILAIAVLIAFVFVFAYLIRIYFTYFYSRQFTRYPPSVAKYLRRAIYFGKYNPDPKRALKNYKLALEECDTLGLDPFSDDVLGIRIQLAAWLEQIENYDAAVKILELLLSDCKRWVDLMEETMKEAGADVVKASDEATLAARLPKPLTRGWMGIKKKETESISENNKDQPGTEEIVISDLETLWGRRSRILRKAIGISVKLGELYSDEHVLKSSLAHERLLWAVDTALAEFRRRAAEGSKKGEGEWMSPREMGASLESLGQSYETRSQFHLALPLFFQALRLCDDPCHSAVIMNNLAATFAQHPVAPPYETLVGSVVEKLPSGELPSQEEARKAYLETAQRWALNANHHANDLQGEARTPECDEACAVSLCNLGDIAALLGNVGEAKKRFKQARAMSEKLEYLPGIKQADAGLSKLSAASAA